MTTVGVAQRRWSDGLLDGMRQMGDPPADEVIEEVLETGQAVRVNGLLSMLVDNDKLNDQAALDGLPAAVRKYVETTDDLPSWADTALDRKSVV
jgi:hypothetical protein